MNFRVAIATPIGKVIIAKFLSWQEWKVANSLERLKLIEDKVISEENARKLAKHEYFNGNLKAI